MGKQGLTHTAGGTCAGESLAVGKWVILTELHMQLPYLLAASLPAIYPKHTPLTI
jgi:hypothetical protein